MHVSFGFVPPFKEEVLEESGAYRVIRRETGVIACEFRGEHSFRMPQWLRFRRQTRRHWEQEILPRLNAASPIRYPEYWVERVRTYRTRDYPLGLRMGSVLGWLRSWMGLKRIAIALYNEPQWIQEMMDYLVEFCCTCGERALRDLDLDYVLLWEDMACKHGHLISPRMFHDFMLEPYLRLTGFIREHGVDLIFVDSDGDAESLIPLCLEGGVNGFYPVERAAGMDPARLRVRFGPQLRLMGASTSGP